MLKYRVKFNDGNRDMVLIVSCKSPLNIPKLVADWCGIDAINITILEVAPL